MSEQIPQVAVEAAHMHRVCSREEIRIVLDAGYPAIRKEVLREVGKRLVSDEARRAVWEVIEKDGTMRAHPRAVSEILEALATLTGEVDEEPVAEGSGAPLPEACKQCGGETMVSPTDVCPRCGGSGDEPRPAAFPERIEVIAGTVPGQAYGVWYPVGDCDVSDYDTWTYAPVPAAQPLPEGEKCEPCERCGGTGWLEEDDEYQRPVDRACSDCTQPVAEVASTDGEDLRLALNAVFNRWADQRYADSVPLNGCEKAKVRATAAAFRNAADYVLDSDPTDTAPNPPSVTDQSSDQGGGG